MKRLFLLLLVPTMLCTPAVAQKTPKWKIDPYTRNQTRLLAKAGYVSYGPFPFGQRGSKVMTTADIDKHLSYAQIRWVETAHFRIGSSLPTYVIPQERDTTKKIRAELEELKKKLPTVKPKTRRLDPWLRVHLFAQRLENHYQEFQQLLGVKDEDFPEHPDKVIRMPGVRYMGMGPYLGMKEKYLVLLCNKEGTYTDYLKNFIGRTTRYTQRWHFKDVGCMFYGTSMDSNEGRFKHDTALHCHTVFNSTINLFDGFRYYSYNLPVWVREGLGHWFGRRVDPRWNSFDQDEGAVADLRPAWKWQLETHKLLANGKFTPFSTAYTWRTYGSIRFNDHVAIWSRIDYLISLGPKKFAEFVLAIKGLVDDQWLPDSRDLVGATRRALQKTYRLNPLNIDEKWAAWVKETYPTR